MYTPREKELVDAGINDCVEYIADMVADGDLKEYYGFINEVNGRKSRRGLPHREPVALVDMSGLTPQDF